MKDQNENLQEEQSNDATSKEEQSNDATAKPSKKKSNSEKSEWKPSKQNGNTIVMGSEDEFFKIHTHPESGVHTLSFVTGASGSNQTKEQALLETKDLEQAKKAASQYVRIN